MNAFLLSNVFYIVYLQLVSPLEEPANLRMETINEVFLLIVNYHYLLFSDFVTNPDTKYTLGWSLIGTLAVMLSINAGFVVTMVLHDAKVVIKAKLLVRKTQARIKERREEMVKQKEENELSVLPEIVDIEVIVQRPCPHNQEPQLLRP